ncbi:MAG: hypothetical protein ACE365_05965 [Gammaproteobacteria bacterium]
MDEDNITLKHLIARMWDLNTPEWFHKNIEGKRAQEIGAAVETFNTKVDTAKSELDKSVPALDDELSNLNADHLAGLNLADLDLADLDLAGLDFARLKGNCPNFSDIKGQIETLQTEFEHRLPPGVNSYDFTLNVDVCVKMLKAASDLRNQKNLILEQIENQKNGLLGEISEYIEEQKKNHQASDDPLTNEQIEKFEGQEQLLREWFEEHFDKRSTAAKEYFNAFEQGAVDLLSVYGRVHHELNELNVIQRSQSNEGTVVGQESAGVSNNIEYFQIGFNDVQFFWQAKMGAAILRSFGCRPLERGSQVPVEFKNGDFYINPLDYMQLRDSGKKGYWSYVAKKCLDEGIAEIGVNAKYPIEDQLLAGKVLQKNGVKLKSSFFDSLDKRSLSRSELKKLQKLRDKNEEITSEISLDDGNRTQAKTKANQHLGTNFFYNQVAKKDGELRREMRANSQNREEGEEVKGEDNIEAITNFSLEEMNFPQVDRENEHDVSQSIRASIQYAKEATTLYGQARKDAESLPDEQKDKVLHSLGLRENGIKEKAGQILTALQMQSRQGNELAGQLFQQYGPELQNIPRRLDQSMMPQTPQQPQRPQM